MRCMVCGYDNLNGSYFCKMCGAEFKHTRSMADHPQNNRQQFTTSERQSYGRNIGNVNAASEKTSKKKISKTGIGLIIGGVVAATGVALVAFLLVIGLAVGGKIGGRKGAKTEEEICRDYVAALNSNKVGRLLDVSCPSKLKSAHRNYMEEKLEIPYEEYAERKCNKYGEDLVFDEIEYISDITDGADLNRYLEEQFGEDFDVEKIEYVVFTYHENGSSIEEKMYLDLYQYDGYWYTW